MGNIITVDAQWALQGKTLGRDGYRVLACSTGSLSADNFTEAIGRFNMGTPETLPQVTVSYLLPGATHYLALAIHKLASEAQTHDGLLTSHDDDGRPVVVTSYYCVPYAQVADLCASYQAMYEAFDAAPLRPENGPVLPVKLGGPPGKSPAADRLAINTAALLLTGRPVCVLGAQETSLTERLDFIDTVMGLLPYGFRAKMTAATWTRATNQNHRFRLFFSGARRDAEQPDNVVFWGRPEGTALTPDDDYAHEYHKWLIAKGVQAMPGLSRLGKPRSFNEKDVLEALDAIDSLRLAPRRRERRREAEPDPRRNQPGKGTAPARDAVSPAKFHGEQFLIDCARYMEQANLPQLSAAVSQLKNSAKAGVTPGQRDRYRELITEHLLFRHNEALGKQEAALRETLLKLAFDPPIGYEDYCLVEDGIGEPSPDSALLQMIEKTGMSDTMTTTLVYRQLPQSDSVKKLDKWYASSQVNAIDLLNLLACDVRRPRHARLICDVAIDYLRRMHQHCEPQVIGRVLRQHSYLARRLRDSEAGHAQYQINVLCWLLKAAYPGRLTRPDIYHVMIGTREPPIPTFLAAVLLMLAEPGDAVLARELYAFSTVMTMELEAATSRELEKLLLIGLPALGAPLREEGTSRTHADANGVQQPEGGDLAQGALFLEDEELPEGASGHCDGARQPEDEYQPRHGTGPRPGLDG